MKMNPTLGLNEEAAQAVREGAHLPASAPYAELWPLLAGEIAAERSYSQGSFRLVTGLVP